MNCFLQLMKQKNVDAITCMLQIAQKEVVISFYYLLTLPFTAHAPTVVLFVHQGDYLGANWSAVLSVISEYDRLNALGTASSCRDLNSFTGAHHTRSEARASQSSDKDRLSQITLVDPVSTLLNSLRCDLNCECRPRSTVCFRVLRYSALRPLWLLLSS
jgi:hypothetical protein